MTQSANFIILGHWDDAEWRAAVATPEEQRTPDQRFMVMRGPRTHPFGLDAHRAEMPDGSIAIFANADAYAKHVGDGPAETALGQLNTGLLKNSSKIDQVQDDEKSTEG